MRRLTIFVPNNFTEDQCQFIIDSAMAQVEQEIRNAVIIPVEVTAQAEIEIAEVKAAQDAVIDEEPTQGE